MRCRLSFALILAVITLLLAAPASAQEDRPVTIDFEVGDFDSSEGDWPITVVNVSGDLEVGEIFVVELRDGDGGVVWAGEGVYSPPTTSVPVDSFVAVGDIEEAAIGQRLPEETTTTTNPPPAEPVVAGDIVTNPTTTSAPAVTPVPPPPPPETTDPAAPPPTVEGDVTVTPEPDLPQQGSGLGGAGQLALSMVIAVVFVAILFRAPLPAATTQRWRR